MPLAQHLYIHDTQLKRNYLKELPHNPQLKPLARDKRKAGYLPEVLLI